jgi:hypothetical protein
MKGTNLQPRVVFLPAEPACGLKWADAAGRSRSVCPGIPAAIGVLHLSFARIANKVVTDPSFDFLQGYLYLCSILIWQSKKFPDLPGEWVKTLSSWSRASFASGSLFGAAHAPVAGHCDGRNRTDAFIQHPAAQARVHLIQAV